MILIDSNVMIDIIESDPHWYKWSFGQIEQAVGQASLIINPIVLAESAPRSGSLSVYLEQMEAMMIAIEPIEPAAAYMAGEVFQTYRARRKLNDRSAILADFFIGAHAQSLDATILTRDPRFYRAYFPTVPLIAPEKDEND